MGPIQYLLKSTEKGLVDFSRVKDITYQGAATKKKIILSKCNLDLQIIADSKVLKFQVLKIRGKIELYLRIRINNCQPNGLTELHYCCVSNWFWITHIIIYNHFAIHPVSLWSHVSNSNKRRKEKRRWVFHALMMCGRLGKFSQDIERKTGNLMDKSTKQNI